jgi:hypothetical protein
MKRPGSTSNGSGGGLTFALQALLERHESYMASSESDRVRLCSTITNLECEKSTLQAANDRIVAENRLLLDQLDGLNTTLAETDDHVKSLEAMLTNAQLEMRRLTVLARHTEELEQQLAEMERGMMVFEDELCEKREEGRSALRRWREAEGRVRALEMEVERIEKEARMEREKHEEIMGRMERRGAVNREMRTVEGRLKSTAGAAALREGGDDRGPTSAVSHFVRDILHDNANLQAGIVELRELLQTSNEEVQNLREQIMLHQPVNGTEMREDGYTTPLVSLDEQLWGQQPQQASQEVHVHHHYHSKFSTRKERTPVARRHSRKRMSIGLGLLESTPESSVPSTPIGRSQRRDSSPLLPALLTRQPVPRARPTRWSVQSVATGSTLSSLPSSPRSYFDRPFDRLEREEEFSRPTSPESAGGYDSPAASLGAGHRKGRNSELSFVPYREMDLAPIPIEGVLPAVPDQDTENGKDRVEEDDTSQPNATSHDSLTDDTSGAPRPEPVPPDPDDNSTPLAAFDVEEIRPLRRSTSHDSLISISGMDIHLAKRKPSQVFVISRGLSSFSAPRPTRTISASQPLASIAEVTASSAKRSFSSDETSSSLAMLSGLAGNTSKTSQAAPTGQTSSGLGQLVGGWVRGRWGIAPLNSSGDLRAQAAANLFAGRPPGINQKGGIPGLRPPARTPSQIHAKVVDEELLKESLTEQIEEIAG